MNVHHYNNKYTGLNSLRTNTIASWWADHSNGATSPATAQGPLLPRAHGGQEGGFHLSPPGQPSRRVSSCCQLRCHMTVLFPSLLIYGQACKCPSVSNVTVPDSRTGMEPQVWRVHVYYRLMIIFTHGWMWLPKGTIEDEMVGWHHQLHGHEFEQAPGVGEGQGGLACSDTTEWLNWTELMRNLCHSLSFVSVCCGKHTQLNSPLSPN